MSFILYVKNRYTGNKQRNIPTLNRIFPGLWAAIAAFLQLCGVILVPLPLCLHCSASAPACFPLGNCFC